MISFLFLFKRTCAHLELKETKYHLLPTVKDTSPLALSMHFYIMNNFAGYQNFANSGILLEYFATLIFNSFSTKLCLRFHHWFFPSEKDLFSWIHQLKETPRRTRILISPVWCKILEICDTLFELVQVAKMQQKLFRNFFTRRSWSPWK